MNQLGRKAFQALCLAAIATALVLVTTATVTAGFDPKTWRFRKPITVPSVVARYAEVPLDGEVYDRAGRSLNDLRAVTADGVEVPYIIRRWPASETMGTVSAPVVNLSVQPRRLTRFELRTLRPGQQHNQVAITIADTEFLPRQVTVEGSDDRRTWFVLAKGEVYRFAVGASVDTIGYPQSVYRFVRVTIHDDGRPAVRVEGAALRFRQLVPPREDEWFNRPVEAITDRQARTSTVTVDTGFARLPLSRLTVTIKAPTTFVRLAQVEASEDATSWYTAARTTLVRTTQTPVDRPIAIPFDEVRARYVRLTVQNGDNQPLLFAHASVHGVQRTMLFPITSGQAYLLYFAGPADPPEYDLPDVLRREPTPPRPVEASVGAVEANPAYVPPLPPRRPWTEEHPQVLWAILGGVGIALALLIVSTVRAAKPRGEP